jgi:hypothetical protein
LSIESDNLQDYEMIIFFQAQLSDEKFLDDHTGKEVGKFVNA